MNFNEYILNEMAMDKSAYTTLVSGAEEQIFYHAAYIILYDDPENIRHWANELFAFASRLKKLVVYGGSKQKITNKGLLTGPHGDNFSENREAWEDTFENILDNEDQPRDFSYDITNEKNREVFFDVMNSFYTWLISWISKTDKNPNKKEFLEAVVNYLTNAKRDLQR